MNNKKNGSNEVSRPIDRYQTNGCEKMLLLLLLSIICLFLVFSEATWYSSEHRICDPTGSSWIAYSGFKINRQYVVKDLKPPMLHFVSLSHCNKGELDYERLTRTGRETDIEWNKPVCMLLSGELKNLYNSQTNEDIEKAAGTRLKLSEVPHKPHSIDFSNNLNHSNHSKRSSKIKQTFNEFLRKISSKLRFIEYTDDSLVTNLQDLNPVSYKDISLKDLDDLKCYKLARRKKYAKREMMIYAPYTWVGGIFECEVSKDAKSHYLSSLQDSRDFIKPFEFKCDRNNSRPLFPLIADDVTNQWIEKEKGLTFSQRIPYLYSPGLLDFRYGKPAKALGLKSDTIIFDDHSIHQKSIDALPYDKWTLELEVNEEYHYQSNDIDLVTETITQTTNMIHHFLKAQKKYLPWEWDIPDLIGPDQHSLIYLEQKFFSVLGKMKDKTLGSRMLSHLQEQWDNLTLSTEQFRYN